MRRILLTLSLAATLLGASLVIAAPATAAPVCTFATPDAPTQVVVDAGQPAVFAIPGLCVPPTATATVTGIIGNAVVDVVGDGSPTARVTLTPVDSTPEVAVATITVTDGTATRVYTLAAYFGVSPEMQWGSGPSATEIEIPVGGTGSVVFDGLRIPSRAECELKVSTSPNDDSFLTEPPNGRGLPVAFGFRGTGFSGVMTVTYIVECTPAGGVASSRTWVLTLYVGVPKPKAELAETGTDPVAVLPFGMGALAAGALALVVSRRRRIRNRAV